ncbi:MAG: bifunctional (p)ppGpp synthetase/guanosine-3',5'-bis(diphosphate) 3'-pyrophosphohydrolase, partial [Epulopiscium sp.]|nr:bifunctional (p)ppGpp synthetase/guanosine-3',5'-bis(diphosphate) 3'-pyrophosphohydrolase [Candidatus Epulonipiscium sp.]
ICAAVGHGGIKEGQIIHRLYEEYQKEKNKKVTEEDILKKVQEEVPEKRIEKKSKTGIVVKGVEDVAVRFSKCCNPVPGDEIIGFITRGRGVSIHRTDCVNMIHLSEEERHRLIEAEWYVEDNKDFYYQTEIQVIGDDRLGLLIDISRVLTDEKIAVKSLNARTTKEGEAFFNITIEIHGKQQLEKLTTKMQSVPGVHEIIRPRS